MITITCATEAARERAETHMALALRSEQPGIVDGDWEVRRGETNSITGCDGELYSSLWAGIFGEDSH